MKDAITFNSVVLNLLPPRGSIYDLVWYQHTIQKFIFPRNLGGFLFIDFIEIMLPVVQTLSEEQNKSL